MKLWTYSTREFRRRWARTLLTLLGITLGIAAIVATRLTIQTVRGAYSELFGGEANQVELEVTVSGGGGLDGSLASSLATVPGVQAVVARVQGVVALVGDGRRTPAPLLGVDPHCLAATSAWPVCAGRTLVAEDEALLDEGLAEGLGLQPGERLRLWGPSGLTELRLVGLVRPRKPGPLLGGALLVPLVRAQGLFKLGTQVNTLRVQLAEGADAGQVTQEIARRLPVGLAVGTPDRRGELAHATLHSTEQGLSALGMVALIVAAFVMVNTILLSQGERRRDFAVLRSLGTTRRQMLWLLARESLALGALGTLLGCVVGVGLAGCLLSVMQQYLGVALSGLQLTPGPFVVAVPLGLGLTLGAAAVPVWHSSYRSPLPDLLAARLAEGGSLWKMAPVGLVLGALGIGLALGLSWGWFTVSASENLLTLALGLDLVGGLLALPLVMVPLLWLAGKLPLGLEGRLALQQLLRRPGRTHLTAGILFLSLVTAIGFGHQIRGTLRDLREWYKHTIVADYMIRGAMPDTTFSLMTALPEDLADQIQQCAPGAVVEKLAFLPAQVNGQQALILARTFAADRSLPLELEEGDAATVIQDLCRGSVVLGTGLSRRLRVGRGDTVTITTARGPKNCAVAGVAQEFVGGGSALYLEWEQARAFMEIPGAHVFLVSIPPDTAGVYGPALREFCAGKDLLFQVNAELAEWINQLMARSTGALWALMVLAFLVAALGVVNTLTMNVAEQTRDFGLLRALGLKCSQIRRLVLSQAALLCWGGLIPAVPAGVGLAWVIHVSSNCWGIPVGFHLDVPVIVGGCGLAFVVALLAALVPAQRAARQSVVRLLS